MFGEVVGLRLGIELVLGQESGLVARKTNKFDEILLHQRNMMEVVGILVSANTWSTDYHGIACSPLLDNLACKWGRNATRKGTVQPTSQ